MRFAMQNRLWFTLPFFGCYNVSYIRTNPDGLKECIFGDDRSSAALQLKVDLYQKYKIEAGAWKPGAIASEIGFENGMYAMILMGPWNIQKFRNAGLDFGIGLIPRISRQEAVKVGLLAENASEKEYLETILPATNVGGANIVVFKTCKHPEVAYDFINYLTSKQAQLKWCRTLKQIPVNVEAAAILREDPNTDKDIKIFMQQALYSTAPPKIPRYAYLENDVVNAEMELALSNKKAVRKALQDAAVKINKNILEALNKNK